MEKALLVIDMLNDFIQSEGRLYIGGTGVKVIDPIQRITQKAREERTHILYICDSHFPQDAEFEMFPPHCLQGTPGADIIDELAPAKGDVIVPKRRFSAFFGTDLDLTLRELKVDELFLTGVCTNICILYTAADARMLNYKVNVHKDAVASFNQEAHLYSLKEMESTLGVTIL